jgi:hypothetical protein
MEMKAGRHERLLPRCCLSAGSAWRRFCRGSYAELDRNAANLELQVSATTLMEEHVALSMFSISCCPGLPRTPASSRQSSRQNGALRPN